MGLVYLTSAMYELHPVWSFHAIALQWLLLTTRPTVLTRQGFLKFWFWFLILGEMQLIAWDTRFPWSILYFLTNSNGLPSRPTHCPLGVRSRTTIIEFAVSVLTENIIDCLSCRLLGWSRTSIFPSFPLADLVVESQRVSFDEMTGVQVLFVLINCNSHTVISTGRSSSKCSIFTYFYHSDALHGLTSC